MKKANGLSNVKNLALAAMLTAMSVVIGIFCKTVLNFADGLFRVTFENLPIILAGIIFGPVIGGIVGAASDLISYLLSAQAYPPNLVVTLGAFSIGLTAGIVARYVIRKRGNLQFIVAGGVAHLIGSMIIKPIGLFVFYNWLVLWRIPLYLIIAPLEILIICLLYKNKAVRRLIDKSVPREEAVTHMTYNDAIAYIHGVSSAFCKPGLERISELCERLGHPERGLKFIHVGGTNGKGSFCSMLDSVLRESGMRVGLYTSPYITEFGERMRVNGENIPEDTLVRLVERVKPIAESMSDKPTEFELITAIAFLYFLEAGVDVVVLEVGLGGRLDSTNVIDSPLLSVITGIALDHTAILGDTVEKIAAEKAGIIKHGVPVLYGGEDEAAGAVIKAVAGERGSELVRVDYSVLSVKSMTLDGTVLDYKDNKDIKISLLGAYQPRNAAVVIEAVTLLRKAGLNISDAAMRKGLAAAVWHARFEIISDNPIMIFDGAHNPQGINAAVESIERYFNAGVYVVSGVLRDKDYERIASTLSSVAKRAYTITPDNSRALSAEEYAEVLCGYGVEAIPMPTITDAVKAAIGEAARDGMPLVCLGSLYTYADVVAAVNAAKESN